MARKAAKKKTTKSKKAKKAVKKVAAKKTATKRAPARKAAKTSKTKKAKPAARKAAAARKPAAKKAVKKTAKKTTKAKSKDIKGEGNYSASRRFRKKEEGFIKRMGNKIAELGHDAKVALTGPDAADLEKAEAETRARGEGMDTAGDAGKI